MMLNRSLSAIRAAFERQWDALARLSTPRRSVTKIMIFSVILFFTLYPNPVYFAEQVHRFNNSEELVEVDFQGIDGINRSIDSALTLPATIRQELQAVEEFVYRNIKYHYDWYNWGVLDYWPPAGEVWRQRKEDCDGRAILAVSILRSRGYETARLVGDINHMWAAVDDMELMGPRKQASFSSAGGTTAVSLPSLRALLRTFAAAVSRYPGPWLLILFFTGLTLLYHPTKRIPRLAKITVLGLVGLFLLQDWGGLYLRGYVSVGNVGFILGVACLIASLLFAVYNEQFAAYIQRRRINKKRNGRPGPHSLKSSGEPASL